MFKPVENNINFPEMEKKWLDHWYKKGIVKKYLLKNSKAKKTFSFLDGPITANNPMGVHHAWGRTYKDLWPKFYNLLGYRQRFQNGFDCQGLWVEVEVEKELGLHSKKDIENLIPGDKKASIAKFVQLCKDRVHRFSKIQTEQSKRLGYFADWDHSYYTMSDENNYMIWLFLKKCFENGWIYKGHESVPWCPRCETAISQHEMLTEDYKELVHESIYLKLPVVGRDKEFLLIWTTTPWTIPANIAVAVDEKLDYSLVQLGSGDKLWVANDVIARVFEKEQVKVLKTNKGKTLVGLKYKGPFDDLAAVAAVAKKNSKTFHIVIPTDTNILPIVTTEGTGLVHTAVSAGVEDFKLGKKLGLPMIPVIADNADYLTGLGPLSGKNAKKNPRVVLDFLKKDWAYKIHNYKHRYPACWRCKTELVWKVADEWYIAMDKQARNTKHETRNTKQKNKTLRQRMMDVAKTIKWMPEFGLDRELDWLKNMHDWLISKKNRYWGLALPIYECTKCSHFEVIGSKVELQKRAVVGWDKFAGHSPHKPFIDEVEIKCFKCSARSKRIDDVGNPWLDAGIVGYSTIADKNQGEPLYTKNKKEWESWFPVDFITESFPGQFKNWFYALIAESTVLENKTQFKRVLGFATQLGEDGRPMHKSWGNAIEFNEGADKIGVDVMRWMFVRQNPSENMLFGYKKADDVRRLFYLMLWNIYKFFVEYSNLDDYKIRWGKYSDKNVLDRWIMCRFTSLTNQIEKMMRNYDAKDAALEIEKFVSDLSTWYIRRSRDRVWVNSDDKEDKQWFYQTLHYVLVNLAVILSPFMPFISEEIYTNLTGDKSVHLVEWPSLEDMVEDKKLTEDMQKIREVCEVGHAKRKELKLKVRHPLAGVVVKLQKNKFFELNKNNKSYLLLIKSELNVKKVELKTGKKEGIELDFDTKMTNELVLEGRLRDLIREIQGTRKQLRILPTKAIELTIPQEFEKFVEFIKKRVLAGHVKIGTKLEVTI